MAYNNGPFSIMELFSTSAASLMTPAMVQPSCPVSIADDEGMHSSSTAFAHPMQVDEGLEDTQGLPRVDGGKDAWLVLAGCFVLEALVWG